MQIKYTKSTNSRRHGEGNTVAVDSRFASKAKKKVSPETPVNIARFLGTPILKNICEKLLLLLPKIQNYCPGKNLFPGNYITKSQQVRYIANGLLLC